MEAINKLPPAVFFIAGGEPFLYRGLIEFINEMPEKHEVLGIVTNLTVNEKIYKKIKRKINFNVSFHREYISVDKLLEKSKELRKHFPVTVYLVATPENIPVIGKIKESLANDKIFLHVDPMIDVDFNYNDEQLKILEKYIAKERNLERIFKLDSFEKKICSAGRNYINLLPDGQVYTCAGGMNYTFSEPRKRTIGNQGVDHFKMGNIFDDNFSINSSDLNCEYPCLDFCDQDFCIIKKKDGGKF